MRILFVGGTKFIGAAAVREAVRRGHEVTVFHRGETEADLPPDVRHVHSGTRAAGPILDYPAELRVLGANVVVHMVLLGAADAQAAVDAFAGHTARLVAISSADVYRAFDIVNERIDAPLEPVPLTEDSALRDRLYPYRGTPDTPAHYEDYDKILAERTVSSHAELPTTVLRLPMMLGPGDPQHRLRAHVQRIVHGRRAILIDEAQAAWRSCWGYVDNIARAITLAAESPHAAPCTYNVADTSMPTLAELIRRLADTAGWEGRVVTAPADALPQHLHAQGRWQQDLAMDSSRIRNELGHTDEVPLDEGLSATLAWERDLLDGSPDEEYAAEDAALLELERSRR